MASVASLKLSKSFKKELKDLFETFSLYTTREADLDVLDSSRWKKFCKDCGFVDKNFTSVDVDMTFQRAKMGEKGLTLKNFPIALQLIAEKRGCELVDVAAIAFEAGGPSEIKGTVPDYIRFHDDEVYSDEDYDSYEEDASMGSGCNSPTKGPAGTLKHAKSIKTLFSTFAYGQGKMSGAQFLEMLGLCKATGSGSGKITPAAAEKIFTSCLERPHCCRNMTFEEFVAAVTKVSEARGMGITAAVTAMVCECPWALAGSSDVSGANTPLGNARHLVDGGSAAEHHRAIIEGLAVDKELTLAAWRQGEEAALATILNDRDLDMTLTPARQPRRSSILARSKSGFPDDDDL